MRQGPRFWAGVLSFFAGTASADARAEGDNGAGNDSERANVYTIYAAMRNIHHAVFLTVLLLLLASSIQAQQEPSANSPAPSETQKPKEKLTIDRMVERLPRRVTSKSGTPGDMVNFVVIGSRDQMKAAFEAAGWILVDKTAQDALQHVLEETIAHRAYSAMPMSQLYLFGRPQDYGWAEGMPIQVVSERNHCRLWEAPWLTPDGQTVWIGAGTHDIGMERETSGQLTHTIDPNVDKEREYIADGLKDADVVNDIQYASPANPVRDAKTATGGSFHSDGRIAIIYLKSIPAKQTTRK